MSARTLYASEDRARYFLVPDDAKVPEGDFTVRSLTGRTLRADPMVIDLYEIPEAEAKEMVRAMLGALGGKLAALAGATAKALREAPRLDEVEMAARHARVAENLRLSREQLQGDPEAVVGAVGDLLTGLLQAAKESVNEPAAADARVKEVAEALRQEGAGDEAAAAVEALPGKLRELLANEDTLRKVDELTKRIEKATKDLEES